MLTNEAIEVHLTYLRSGFDAMQSALPVLRDKIDQLSEKMDEKFAASNAALVAMIEKADAGRAAGDAALADMIQRADDKRAASDATLAEMIRKASDDTNEKLGQVGKDVAGLQGMVRAILWLLASLVALITLVPIGFMVARALHGDPGSPTTTSLRTADFTAIHSRDDHERTINDSRAKVLPER